MAEIIENRIKGQMYPTERVHIAAVLKAAGHKVHEYKLSPTRRLVFVFPMRNAEGRSVHDTLRDYANNELPVDAKTVIDSWMEFRDMTRNKEFAIGTPPEA